MGPVQGAVPGGRSVKSVLNKIVHDKEIAREQQAAKPVAEKLRTLERLRDRDHAIKKASRRVSP